MFESKLNKQDWSSNQFNHACFREKPQIPLHLLAKGSISPV